MNKENNETLLTAKELDKLGDTVADVKEVIELYNNTFEFTKRPNEIDRSHNGLDLELNYRKAKQLIDTMFNMNQKLIRDLDHVSYTLYENNEKEHVEELRKGGLI